MKNRSELFFTDPMTYDITTELRVRDRREDVPCRLAERESFLQDAEDRLRHGLGPPGLEGSAFPEAQIVHQTLVGVPALLPHGLQLVLVAVC